jgi:hypothetical protein
MKHKIVSGCISFGIIAAFAFMIAAPGETSAAEIGAAPLSYRWSAPTPITADHQWTNLSIHKQPRGSNRGQRWFGPYGWRAIVSAEYASPLETDWSHATSGSGAELSLVTPSPQGFGFRFSLGWSGIGIDDGWKAGTGGSGAPWPPNLQVIEQHRSLDAFRTFLSIQYRTLPPRAMQGAPEFTVYGGFGAVTLNMDADILVADDSTGQTFRYSGSQTSTTPAFTFGCAGSVMFTPRVGVETSLSSDILLNEERKYYTDGLFGFDNMERYDGSWAWRVGLILAF